MNGNNNKANQDALKVHNLRLVLNCIRAHKEISKIEISKVTGLSPSTVTLLVSELIEDKGYVKNLGVGLSKGGRKPLILGLNPASAIAASFVVTKKNVKMSVFDINLKCIYSNEESPENIDSYNLADIIIGMLSDMKCRLVKLNYQNCYVGISIPGIIDSVEGIVLYSSKLKLHKLHLARLVFEKTAYPVFLFKDSDALMLGEYKYGVGSRYSDILYLSLDDGIGMSYIKNGEIFLPGAGGGLEIGHMIIELGGRKCRCGVNGCVAAYLTRDYIVEMYNSKGNGRLISDLSDLVSLSNDNESDATSAIMALTEYLAVVASNSINLFNPNALILGGPLIGLNWNYQRVFSDKIEETALKTFFSNLDVCCAMQNETGALRAMAESVFEAKIF